MNTKFRQISWFLFNYHCATHAYTGFLFIYILGTSPPSKQQPCKKNLTSPPRQTKSHEIYNIYTYIYNIVYIIYIWYIFNIYNISISISTHLYLSIYLSIYLYIERDNLLIILGQNVIIFHQLYWNYHGFLSGL